MKKIILFLLLFIQLEVMAQTTETYTNERGHTHLIGKSQKSDLLQEPYSQWYHETYNAYETDKGIIESSRKQAKNVSVKLYMGTWCGDSRRQVPRFYKVAEELGMAESEIALINLSSEDGLYKQCPTHEERGENIHRVPTFIFYKNDKEIGRIVESPITSFEMDMAQIFNGLPTAPRYTAVTYLNNLFETESLDSINSNFRDHYVKSLYLVNRNNSELNTYGNVLLDKEEYDKAILVFRINANIFRDEARMFNSLGNAYLESGNEAKAIETFKMALDKDSNNKYTSDILLKLATELKS